MLNSLSLEVILVLVSAAQVSVAQVLVVLVSAAQVLVVPLLVVPASAELESALGPAYLLV